MNIITHEEGDRPNTTVICVWNIIFDVISCIEIFSVDDSLFKETIDKLKEKYLDCHTFDEFEPELKYSTFQIEYISPEAKPQTNAQTITVTADQFNEAMQSAKEDMSTNYNHLFDLLRIEKAKSIKKR